MWGRSIPIAIPMPSSMRRTFYANGKTAAIFAFYKKIFIILFLFMKIE